MSAASRDVGPATGRQVIDLSLAKWRVQRAGGGIIPPPPPPPDCVFLPDIQLSDPGSKHTKPPHSAADEDTCCQVCMADKECVGAVLYGTACYPKTAVLPHVKQAGVTACVQKNRSSNLLAAESVTTPPIVPATVPGDILAALERGDALGIQNQSIYYSTNLKSASVQAAQNASYWLNSSVVVADAAFIGSHMTKTSHYQATPAKSSPSSAKAARATSNSAAMTHAGTMILSGLFRAFSSCPATTAPTTTRAAGA